MCNRRNKPICQGAVLLAIIGGLGYTFYLYNLTKIELEVSRSETDKHFKQKESLSSQLQVVYEHRARLERSLQKEKTDQKNTKLEFSRKQNDFLLNVTRSKHEAMNRFNSLETQYNMLKAQNKELDTDYNRLQQQYSRLSSEQSAINNQQKRNFQLYKEQKTNEIASLDEEIKTLKQQVVSLRTYLKSKTEEAEQYKISSSRALRANQKYQETLSSLQEQLSSYKEKLKIYVAQLKTSKAANAVKHDNNELGEVRHQGGNVLDPKLKRADRQEVKGEPKQGKESLTGPSRGVSRHHQDRVRRQVHVQVTPPSDYDADQADMRRPPDKNVNEQKQDDESHSDKSHDGIVMRNSDKVKDNSQSESNIPLRDSNQDARLADEVIPPAQNAMNKWADILKAAEQDHEVKGVKREQSNKEINKEWAGEREEGRNRLDGDHKQEAVIGENKQTQLGEEEVSDEQLDKPVVQTGHVADRPGEQGNQDNQGYGLNEEAHKQDEAGDLSRENMNRQVADIQENYQQEQIKQQEQPKAIWPQEHAGYNQVVPIPAVKRQIETAQEHRAQADADNDDEDADNDQNNEEDPDEQDPDDANEDDDPPHQQQQVHHGDRALKAAEADKQQQV